jgi:hypothetical protein
MYIEIFDINNYVHTINSSDPEILSKWLLEKAKLLISNSNYEFGRIHITSSPGDPHINTWAVISKEGMDLIIGTLIQIKKEAFPENKAADNNEFDRLITDNGDPENV